jgi:hypothetical protein
MISGFLVKKGQMTSIYTEDGKRIAVTKCIAKPLIVTQIKNKEKDDYQAVQVAYGERRKLDNSTSSKLTKLKIEALPKGFQEFELISDRFLKLVVIFPLIQFLLLVKRLMLPVFPKVMDLLVLSNDTVSKSNQFVVPLIVFVIQVLLVLKLQVKLSVVRKCQVILVMSIKLSKI